MSETWRARLKRIIEERGLDMKNLSRSAGLGETAVRDWLERDQTPKVSSLAAVGDVLGMSLDEIYAGEAGAAQRIPIIGAVAAGEGWTTFDDGLGEIEVRVEGGEPVALEVRGDSMAPVYRDGDLLIGAKRSGERADNLIGLDCIVMTDGGARYVKFLARGTVRGRFNLRSYNPAQKDIENVKLAWAAPILWVKRGQR